MTMSADEYYIRKVREYGRSGPVTFIDEPEPEKLFCPIISPDDHLLEPATMFEGRLPARLQSFAPFMGPGEEGAPWWVIDGTAVPVIMVNGAAGRPMDEWTVSASRYDEFRRGVWDPHARVADMDTSGVWASLCFSSTMWGFAGTRFSKMSDPEVGLACLKAYNDWMFDEWCGAVPDRLIPCQLTWFLDADDAAAEIYRNAARGVHAVSFSENPEPLGFPNIYDRYWDPFFRACEETNTVINLHVGSSGVTQKPSSVSPESVGITLFPLSGMQALADWIFSGVLLRFPKLTIALSEAGCSWVPMMLERLARAHRQAAGHGSKWPSDAPPPMELVQRNFVFTSLEDPSGFHALDLIGENNVMVETDFPHSDSTWPHSQEMIRGELSHLSRAQIRKVCYENAARIYQTPPPPRELIASSEIGLPD